jgi:glycosyltransferase involved in cell wall biosynthesis
MPTVSIILPTYNRTEFLRIAIESVYAQTYTDWEMIIADDGSSEETRRYLRSITAPHVRTIWLQHSGNPSRVRNTAIEAASGRYLAFLDSDDIWAPSKLERQIIALEARSGSRWCYTLCDHIDENGRPLERKRLGTIDFREGWIFEPLLRLQFSVAMPTLVAERDLVREIGGFDEEQLFAEFHDFCLRLAMRSEVVALRESLCSVRTHTEHYSGDRVAANAGWMRLYEKMMALAPSKALRSHCVRMRTETSLSLARIQADRGDYWGAWKTLGRALAFSWRYPKWWYGALYQIMRPVIPGVVVSALRRIRSN